MGFAAPIALWGLLALPLLFLLSFWRLRPVRLVVPSVLLWRELPDRVPPVRALRRPRWSASLLMQMLAVALGVIALAGPYREATAKKPRKVAVVVDLSARMWPRLDAAKEAYGKLREALPPTDRVVTYTFPPLARHEGAFGDWEIAQYGGDPALALDLAVRESDLAFFVGDRPVALPREQQILVGGPMANTGVVDANVDRGAAYLRIVRPGSPHDGELVRYEPQAEIRVANDAFPLDDVLYLDRFAGLVEVALEGRPHAAIRRVLERLPGVRLVKGGRPDVVVRVGQAARPDDPPARVLVDPPGEGTTPFTPSAVALADHPLLRSVAAEEVRLGEARELRDGIPLMSAGGKTVAALRGREIVIAASIPPEGWPAYPSFPIFWANVLEFLTSGRTQEWRAHRTGEPIELPDDRTVLASRVGENRFGNEVVHANLLDANASDLSGESRPFDASRLPPVSEEPRRSDVSAWPAALTLVCVILSWWLEKKGN